MSSDIFQKRIDSAIRAMGGYWPPLAGVARIIEELSELAACETERERVREAVDCVVASVAVANQYCVKVRDRQTPAATNGERVALIQAGKVARIVNRFEGVKPPKPLEGDGPTLELLFCDLVDALAAVAGMTTTQIIEAAAAVAESNAERDAARFTPRRDAVTAVSREAYIAEMGIEDLPTNGVWGVDAVDPAEIAREIQRFLRVDAIHPMRCLVAGPFDMAHAPSGHVRQAFRDQTHEGRTAVEETGSGTFVRVAGSAKL